MIVTWSMSFIVLLIIYIPLIYIIVKKGKKFAVKTVLIILILLLMPIVYVTIIYNFPYYYLEPFEGKVIDIDTKSPISGAAVLAVYYKEVPSIAGSNSYAIDAQETLTNKNGEFRIPEVKKWFGDNNGEPEGHLTIFKPGYGRIPGGKGVNIVGAVRAIPEKYIVYELPKLKTREERDRNLMFRQYTSIPYEKRKYLFNLVNEERIKLGYKPLTIPK
jgi:hypothetical protein